MTSRSDTVRIGVDFGGTKIEAIAIDVDGKELRRQRVPTPRGDYASTLKAICELVNQIESELAVQCSVGVGIPGAISPASGLVKNANSTWCAGQAFDQDLSKQLNREVRMANDANCLALSEATDGAGAGSALVFAVVLGTGVGGGIAINGRPWTGQHAIGGEWGHNPLPWPDNNEHQHAPLCYCGKRGCIETYLSGPGFAASYQNLRHQSGHKLAPGEQPSTAPAIINKRDSGDALATAAWSLYVDRLARALASLINVLDPDVIVLGGGMSNVEQIYTDVPTQLQKYVFSDTCQTPIRAAQHGDSSGVRGAAWLW